MDLDKTTLHASRLRRIVLLFILLLTAGMIVKRMFGSVIKDPEAPYPLRLLATAEPSTLLLLTLVLLVMLLVGSRRGTTEKRGSADQSHDERHEAI